MRNQIFTMTALRRLKSKYTGPTSTFCHTNLSMVFFLYTSEVTWLQSWGHSRAWQVLSPRRAEPLCAWRGRAALQHSPAAHPERAAGSKGPRQKNTALAQRRPRLSWGSQHWHDKAEIYFPMANPGLRTFYTDLQRKGCARKRTRWCFLEHLCHMDHGFTCRLPKVGSFFLLVSR